ncbi:DNA replication/repair protein RecF [Aquisalimonas lutea]|uniref:DNA replication/repair protein RecF n=1 Tax=Aquisalimonas lutea TaxID=1327750 RepID=UPI0025B4CB50|nr:DNA replication/repair protein RecF [Aquisalimonas lutea]MDN3516620.1 DNA replication/repair protein RecF [Aquisalimonas lutea]
MAIARMSLSGVRNLRDAAAEFDDDCNVITGANGAGKTSVLEAIHILARARSFRSSRLDRVRRDGTAPLMVTGEAEDGVRIHRLGVGRDGDRTRVRIDGEDAGNLSALARLLPVQVINTESQRLLLDGPDVRRSFINWTVFHVEPEYHEAWQRYQRALKQRNAALRSEQARLAVALEPELVAAGEKLDRLRRRIVEALEPPALAYMRSWLDCPLPELRFRSGWAQDEALESVLKRQRETDLSMGYTLSGPHRADLQVRCGGMEARYRLSRGQQKVVVIALLLAQAELIAGQAGPRPVLLVDDLPAELDPDHRSAVVTAIRATGGQCFLTAIESDALPVTSCSSFHVEQGTLRKVI